MVKKFLIIILISGTTTTFASDEWTKVTGGTLRDVGTDIVIAEEHAFVSGYTRSFGSTGNNSVIGKFTLEGNLLWINPYDTEGDDILLSIMYDTETNTIWGAGYAGKNMYVVQIETSGRLIQKLMLEQGVAEKIIQAGDKLVLAGWQALDIFTVVPVITQIDHQGNTIWKKTGLDGRAYDICQTEEGFIAAGYSDTETRTIPWIMEINNQETIQLHLRSFSWFTEIYHIELTENGYLFSIATWDDTNIQAVVIKTDKEFNELWVTQIDDMLYGYDITVLPDGNIILGSSDRTLNYGDISLIQLDKNGMEIDRYIIGGYLEDWLQNLAVLPDGRCIFTGVTYSYGSPIDCDIITGMTRFPVFENPKSLPKNSANFSKDGGGGSGCFIHSLQF